ncbi:ABC transporter ATP-binding protein [Iamia sp. SCSIO 61187]|uniref:ATP-binding cassette domain-containing protein n=1 Tax=Iamia sp. SCSIO 61187 TaxID=2722752 RepID=UPI001C62CCAB|nr:ABC transporter ATP-binding protein [Iamia sp. SCSIO 61187]QYG92437.1 ABC transporter ATP-binding protein [Iamia sp. SCSIO 61187]
MSTRAGDVRTGARLAAQVLRRDPVAWSLACGWWTLFHSLPVATGLALGAVLDAISGAGRVTVPWAALAVLAGIEVSRWSLFLVAVVQWHGAWVGWHTVIRLALLDSLVTDPGPVDDRLPGSSGEAVSRFRDDTEDAALVLDVWLDVVGTSLAAVLAVGVLLTIDVRLALTVALPAVVVMVLAHGFGPRLRVWRRAARQATARVTGFVGDTFGAIASLKAAGAEGAAVQRFAALGEDRARHAARDEVGTQLLYTLSGTTADLALAASLVAAAPAVARGDLTVGDLGVIAAFSTVVASLPRFVGRLGAYHRQADVSADRLARLLPPERRSLAAVAGTHELRLRAPRRGPADAAVGPVPGVEDPDLPFRTEADRRSRHPSTGDHPAGGLEVRRLTVRRHGVLAVDDVDLTVRPGELVAVTGPVGAGKSSLLRAVLGLVPFEGTLRWDGQDVSEPSRVLVPPRVAYVPQVPRLFSEPLADAVLLGLPRARLPHALRLSRLERDVAAMPEGLATVVGSRGVRLSGGQVQRVAAARALARRPALLVVDDLSSALDATTEAELWEGLLAAAAEDGTSVLVVTHRPAVLARADDVVRMEAGRRV